MLNASDLRAASRRDLVELLAETLLRRLLAPLTALASPREPSTESAATLGTRGAEGT